MATVEVDVGSTQARFEKSDYAQVVFHNIAETYPTDANVDCHYTITSYLMPSSRDWVGLYKVGWSSSREYVYFEWSPKSADYKPGLDNELHIMFRASSLPKDDGEFYQFCYVTSSGQVRGASTPFQFKQPGADDFVEIIDDEDNDLLVVKSKTLALEDDLMKALIEKENILKQKNLLEQERETLLTKIVECERKYASEQKASQALSSEVQTQKERIACLDHEAQDMNLVLESLTEKITSVNKEKDEILTRLDENDQYIKKLQAEIKSLANERDALTGKVKVLEEQKELFKSHFTMSESTLQGYQSEVEGLKRQVEEKECACVEEAQTVNMLQEQLETEKQRLSKQLSVNQTQRDHINELTEGLKNQEDKLAAAEHCKQLLNEEVNAMTMAHTKMSQGFEAAKSESHSLKVQMVKIEEKFAKQETLVAQEIEKLHSDLEEKEKENESLKESVAMLTSEMEEMERSNKAETEGPLYALKTAQAHLKERYARMKLQNDDIKRQLDELLQKQQTWKQKEGDLQREVSDLKDRLLMGAEEYKVKYKECKKLQHDLKKLQRQMNIGERRRLERAPSADVVVEIETPVQGAAPCEKQESSTQVEKPQTVEVGTGDSQDGKILEMSCSELQSQLDDLGYELEQRNVKKNKYKQLYQDEHEKRAFLEQHYYAEVKKAQQEVVEVKDAMSDAQAQHQQQVHNLQVIIKKQREEISQLKEKLPEIQSPAAAALTVYPDPYTPPPTSPATSSAHFTLRYGNPYANDATVTPAPAVVKYPDTERACPEGSLDTAGGAACGDLTTPLTPLPAPLLPEVLPSAKIAAVKAVAEGNRSEPLIDDQLNANGLDAFESTDGDEERFLDADGEPQKICPLCSMTFPIDHPTHMLENHIESHYGPVCPMCTRQFPKDIDHTDFETHVQSHFDDIE